MTSTDSKAGQADRDRLIAAARVPSPTIRADAESVELASPRQRVGRRARVAEFPAVQMRVGHAAMALKAAKALMF